MTEEQPPPEPEHGTERGPPRPGGEHRPSNHGGEHRPSNHGGERRPSTHGGEHRPSTHGGERRPSTHGGERRPSNHGGEHRPSNHGGEHRPSNHGGERRPSNHGGEHRPPNDGAERRASVSAGERVGTGAAKRADDGVAALPEDGAASDAPVPAPAGKPARTGELRRHDAGPPGAHRAAEDSRDGGGGSGPGARVGPDSIAAGAGRPDVSAPAQDAAQREEGARGAVPPSSPGRADARSGAPPEPSDAAAAPLARTAGGVRQPSSVTKPGESAAAPKADPVAEARRAAAAVAGAAGRAVARIGARSPAATGPAATPAALPVPVVRDAPLPGRPAPPPADRRSTRAARLSSTAQEAPLEPREVRRDALSIAIAAVLRLVALAWIAASVDIWARLVGYLDTPLTLTWHAADGPWLAIMTAAVLGPCVAVGLWILAPWGVVLWVGAVAADGALAVLAPALMPFGVWGLVGNLAALGPAAALFTARAVRDQASDGD